jgi:MSHA pilin protein MshC
MIPIFKERLKRQSGFTFLEIIAVMVIMGIVAAVVITRFIYVPSTNLQAEINTLKGHLRFAQSKAMNDLPGIKWGIKIGSSSYTLIRVGADGNESTPVFLPDESSATRNFSPITAAAITVLFDDWGRPGQQVPTMGGVTISITPNTGFIP